MGSNRADGSSRPVGPGTRLSEGELADRVAALSLEQKVRLLTGADFWSLHPEPAVGLRRIVVSDGPAGVRGVTWDERSPSVNVPAPTALGATWDVSRVEQLGRLLAAECRRKSVDVLLAPTVNLQRSPYGGRHFEMFSEDPLLTAELGAAYVAGLQSEGIGATVKHFVANDSETERRQVNMVIDERTLREVYLAPFETIVTRTGAWAAMAAYNQTNGVTMTESPLLRDVLKDEWGFDGVAMTDWFAGRSTEAAGNGGLDLVMPGPNGPWGSALVRAVKVGRVREEAIDDKVLRLLRLAVRVGALDGGQAAGGRPAWSEAGTAAELRAAAAGGFVLLRNVSPAAGGVAEPVLPLRPGLLRRVAVLGPNAVQGRTLGGGAALVFPPYVVHPLAGLVSALRPGVAVDYAPGVRAHTRLPPADIAHLLLPDTDQPGIEVSFVAVDGQELARETRFAASYTWHGTIGDVDPAQLGAIRVRTRLRAPRSGEYLVGGSGIGQFALRVDEEEQFEVALSLPDGTDPAEGLMRPPQHGHAVMLSAGQVVEVELTYRPAPSRASFDAGMVSFQLNVEPPADEEEAALAEAVTLATNADVAIVVVGTNEEVESEGFDRDSLALPGRQDELVHRVAQANPRTVVVVNAGSPVLLPWRNEVAAVLVTWFAGQEFGHALADVLLGAAEPGGRLPMTWPAEEGAPLARTRPVDGAVAYAEGVHVGHRSFLRTGIEPAYWFGHGLGYTTWAYGEPEVRPDGTGGAEVRVRLANTGDRSGRQVVQVYASKPASVLDRPVRWLAGFVTVDLGPGKQTTASVSVAARRFLHWDVAHRRWAAEPGPFDLHVAQSAGAVLSSITFDPACRPAPHPLPAIRV